VAARINVRKVPGADIAWGSDSDASQDEVCLHWHKRAYALHLNLELGFYGFPSLVIKLWRSSGLLRGSSMTVARESEAPDWRAESIGFELRYTS
jgi:hypothetical protein